VAANKPAARCCRNGRDGCSFISFAVDRRKIRFVDSGMRFPGGKALDGWQIRNQSMNPGASSAFQAPLCNHFGARESRCVTPGKIRIPRCFAKGLFGGVAQGICLPEKPGGFAISGTDPDQCSKQ
jgi:hypothetical protein